MTVSEKTKKTRTRLATRSGIKTYEEANEIRQEYLKQKTLNGKEIDKVKVFLRKSRGVFDVVVYGPQREVTVE